MKFPLKGRRSGQNLFFFLPNNVTKCTTLKRQVSGSSGLARALMNECVYFIFIFLYVRTDNYSINRENWN